MKNYQTLRTLALLLMLGSLLASASAAGESGLRAAAAAIDVTPPVFPAIVNGGFLEKQATQAFDPLYARAIVLDDGTTRLAICVVDTCMMTRELIDSAKEQARRETGIPTERMLVSATHTHSAGSAMACLGTRLDKRYAAFLPGKIAEAIATASKNLVPARAGWGSAPAWEYTNCRRWIRRPDRMLTDPFGVVSARANMHPGYQNPDAIAPSGPIDPELSLLSIQARDGRPLALLANFSMHYFGAAAISADYFGKFASHIGQQIGAADSAAFVGIMSQGTSGDSQWMDYSQPKKSITSDQYTDGLVQIAAAAYRKIKYRDAVPLAMAEARITLRRRVADAARLEWARKIAEPMSDRVPATQAEVYARERLLIAAEPERELKLQALRIGELGITAIPDEVYAITGLKLKAQSPLRPTFTIELANGSEGYIPPPEQHKLGGYTTWAARTAGLEPQAEPRIVETVLDLLEQVSGGARRPIADGDGPYAKAVLAAKPLAYWRMNEIAPPTAFDASGHGHHATYDWEHGVAFYLPGAGNGAGASSQPVLDATAFSGPNHLNRSPHFAGGAMKAVLKDLGDDYTVSFWLWNGLDTNARPTTGIAFAHGALRLGITGIAQSTPGRLFLGIGSDTAPVVGRTALLTKDWHQVTLVRQSGVFSVYLDGKPELSGKATATEADAPLFFAGRPEEGNTLEGKIDEAAVFKRALAAEDITNLWKTSGIEEERTRQAAARQRAEAEAAQRANPPQFATGYEETVRTLKPIVSWSFQQAPRHATLQGGLKFDPKTFAELASGRVRSQFDKAGTAYTVSVWFKNETANDAQLVTAYLFSRGREGDAAAPGDHLGIGGSFNSAMTGRLFFYNGNAIKQTVTGTTVIPPGTWNHAVFIREGRHVKAFLNGIDQPEFTGEADDTTAGVRDFFVGARSDMFAPIHGYMAQFALFDRVLTDAEALSLHTASGQPKGTPAPVPRSQPVSATLPLSPEESLKKIHVPAGFRVERIACEPLVLDPVAFDWDERGRLWVVEMADYPLGMDGKGKPGGRVRILEDTHGDGHYDKSTLFAEGLNFPNGILCWRGGCLVTAAPDILFLEDAKGTGKADVQRKLFSGFLEGNQQLRVNGLRWGLDGWVYCANGGHHANYGKEVGITSLLTGEKIPLGSRDFRFKPDTGELDPLSGPSQFGRNRDPWNHWFGVQNSFPIWHYVLEDRYLRRNPYVTPPNPRTVMTASNPPVYAVSGPQKRYHSFNEAGRFTSACAGAIYLDTFLFGPGPVMHSFTCEPVSDLVQHFIVEEDGVSYKARRAESESEPDFFASEDRWCRPVMTRTGPDGALWIADMYRYMIEHPQFLPPNGKDDFLPFYRAGEDKGRIYRVVAAGTSPMPYRRLDTMSEAELVALLESSNGWQRDKAHMMLLWRGGDSAVPALRKLAAGSKQPIARAQALSVLDGLGALQPTELVAALHDEAAGVREHALRLTEHHGTDAVVEAAAKLAEDPNAKVRLQLACSLGEWKQLAAGEALVKIALQDREDPIIRGAVVSSLPPHLSMAAARLQNDPALLEPLLGIALGEKRHDLILSLTHSEIAAASAVGEDSLRRFRNLLRLFREHGATVEKLAREHAGDAAWTNVVQKKTQLLDQVKILAQDESRTPSSRAFFATVLLADPSAESSGVELLGGLIRGREPAEPFGEWVGLLAQSTDVRIPDFLMQDWDSRTPAQRMSLLDAMMGREDWARKLLDHVKQGKVSGSSFDFQRQARLLKHPSAEVRKLAEDVFAATANSSRAKVIEAFQPALSLKGDPVKGKAVFATACVACHQLEGVGRVLGPDLRSVVGHDPAKLLSSILDPSAVIEPGFTAYFCELKNGEQLYGIIAAESGASITLKLVDTSTRDILRSEIVKLQSSRASLMPDGLEALLTPQSLADLIAYLKQSK